MSASFTSSEEFVCSLKRCVALLEARRSILKHILRTSTDMLTTLKADAASDIGEFLRMRESDCRRHTELTREASVDVPMLLERARLAAEGGSGDGAELARRALALDRESEALTEQILARQNECESTLKQRIQVTASALRQSTQRRKLNATYGPAHNSGSPIFLDSQQ